MSEYTFTPDSVTIAGRTFPAGYSVTPSGSVVVFATLPDAAETARIRFTPDHADHAAALAAAKGEKEARAPKRKPAAKKPKPAQETPEKIPEGYTATTTDAGKVIAIQRNEFDAAETVQPAPADAPETVQPAADPAPEAPQAAPVETPAQEAKQARGPVPEKDFIGQTITGRGWRILFDGEASRTRVIFDAEPTDAARAALDKAGFYFSPNMNSFNKKLTHKAHRAAVALSGELRTLYA